MASGEMRSPIVNSRLETTFTLRQAAHSKENITSPPLGLAPLSYPRLAGALVGSVFLIISMKT